MQCLHVFRPLETQLGSAMRLFMFQYFLPENVIISSYHIYESESFKLARGPATVINSKPTKGEKVFYIDFVETYESNHCPE